MISIINAGIKTMLGDGSAGNPYQIRTEKQLYDFSVCVNAGNDCTNQHYIMTADIDLSGYSSGAGWTPIGIAGASFNGNYNGNGFTIRNLTQAGQMARGGLFGACSSATLKNIGIASGSISGAFEFVGGVCGGAFNTNVIGCYNKASITSTATNSITGCGGLVGNAYRNAGAMAITDCFNGGAISANMTSTTAKLGGGIIGRIQGGTMTRSRLFNHGLVTSSTGATLNSVSSANDNSYYDSTTSGATDAAATGRATADCQGTDALTNAGKLNNLGTVNWFARQGYPLPIRFNK